MFSGKSAVFRREIRKHEGEGTPNKQERPLTQKRGRHVVTPVVGQSQNDPTTTHL